MPKVEMSACVIGAGVVGLTSALSLLNLGHRVEILSAARGSQTCSANAGAIWGPFLSKEDDRVFDWSFRTLEVLRELAQISGSGVSIVDGVLAADYETEIPDWFKLLNQDHDYDGEMPEGYVRCWRYSVPIIDMPEYLCWLEREVVKAGGRFEQRKVLGFEALLDRYDFVVNCTGMGSKELCNDDQLYPAKGQLIVVENPGVQDFFAERGDLTNLFYWMPQGKKVVIGGTAEEDFEHRDVDQHQVDRMLQKAQALEPRFASSSIIDTRVGFRPCRETVRLEADSSDERLIHNYGHGGSGVSISWGCAQDLTKLVPQRP